MPPPFDLIERYLDGELSSEQEPALEEWLGSDREHLRIFLREVHLSRGMRELRFEPGAAIQTQEPAEETSAIFGLQLLRWAFARATQHPGWVALGGALALLFVGLAWNNFSSIDVSVTADRGLVLRRDGSEQVVNGKVKLRSGDTLRTESSARALIQYGRERTQLEVGGGTSVEILQKQRTKLVRLNVGTIYGAVARQRFGSSLQFVTSQGRAKILGTDIKLTSLPDRTELEVYSGQVLLARSRDSDSEGIPIKAGYSGLVVEGREISEERIPPAAGWILWEYWPGIPGATIADLTGDARFAAGSDRRGHRESFETPRLQGDNYGARVRGYLHPPRTGDYKFWITGDDAAELWLSPDHEPSVKHLVCSTTTFTGPEQWEKYPTQRSNPIHLVGGRKYYIEALLKQSGGSDGLAVAWQGPGMVRQIIAGAYLSPETEERQRTPP